jgi:hypothetical protein
MKIFCCHQYTVPASSVYVHLRETYEGAVYMYRRTVRKYVQYTARIPTISYIYGRLRLIGKCISSLSFSFQHVLLYILVLEVHVLGVFSVLCFLSKDLWCRHE